MNRVRLIGTALAVLCAAGATMALASQRGAAALETVGATAVGLHQTTPETYKVDGVHSSIIFRIDHMGIAPFYGAFTDVSGTYQYDPDHPERSSFNIVVKTDSVDTRNENRDNHLKSPDFFNAVEYPEITFKSTKVLPAGKNKLKVTGDLTLHGQTQPVEVDMTLVGRSETKQGFKSGFDVTFAFKRSDFGMDTYVAEGGLGDEVKLMIGLEGARQE